MLLPPPRGRSPMVARELSPRTCLYAGLTPCKKNKAFQKREKQEVKACESVSRRWWEGKKKLCLTTATAATYDVGIVI